MSLMPSHPLLGPERLTEHIIEEMVDHRRDPQPIPMVLSRRGGDAVVCLDLPGFSAGDVEITIERNVVTIRAQRCPVRREGDEAILDERPSGVFVRQVFLTDSLNADRMTADYVHGELRLTMPVSQQARPRRIDADPGDAEPSSVTTTVGGGGGEPKAGTQDIVLRVIRPGWNRSAPDVRRTWSAQARRELIRMRAVMHAQPLDAITTALRDGMRRAAGGWIDEPDLARTAARLHRGAYVAVEIVDGPAPASD